MIKTLLILALFVGCLPEDRPERLAVISIEPLDGTVWPEYLAGAEGWSPLGFEVEVYSELPDCVIYLPDCKISVEVEIAPRLIEQIGSDGMASLTYGRIYLDDDAWTHGTEYLQHIVSHEVGHIILRTSRHSKNGLLSGDTSLEMSEDDFRIACEEMRICL